MDIINLKNDVPQFSITNYRFFTPPTILRFAISLKKYIFSYFVFRISHFHSPILYSIFYLCSTYRILLAIY